MKKYIAGMLLMSSVASGFAQNSNKVNFELGNGLNISLNNNKHHFNIGGYIQTGGSYTEVKDLNPEWRFDVKKAYLNFSGGLQNDKFTFLLQMDFAKNYPLLDAWMAYHPTKYLTVSAGQKQSFSGTRSMMFNDQALAFGSRSLVDRTFFASGRELGIFVESRIPVRGVGFDLGVAATTGDGINSFGSSATDFDLGGLKYSARGTFYPMGFFAPGNELTDTDFAREKSPKIMIGGAYSYNRGASDAIGEGHGNFQLFDENGKGAYPDYIKMSFDVMMKYQGFTFLAEYVDAWARNLNGLYTAATPGTNLQPQQIANYLVLGSGVSAQAGYLFKKNWAVDFGYSYVFPEWKEKNSLIQKTNSYRIGVAKYFIDNRLKLQLSGAYEQYNQMSKNDRMMSVELNAHVVF